MTTTKHTMPGYDAIAAQLEEAAQMQLNFSPSYCWTLLETADSYAQEAASLQQRNNAIEPILLDLLVHLQQQAQFSKQARLNFIQRVKEVLKIDHTYDTSTI